VEDVEFRLGRGYRIRPLVQAGVALVLAAALYAAGFGESGLKWLALFPLAYAAGSIGRSALRSRVSTRLTAQGIEIRHYRRRFVPWQSIKDIEALGYDRVADVPVENFRSQRVSSSGRGPRTVAAVEIVRTSGHRIKLPAPVVTDSQDDPDFADKAQQIKARWEQAVAGTV
jgi:hypothetical protein